MVAAKPRVARAPREQVMALQQKDEVYSLALLAGRIGVWEWHPQTGAFLVDPMLLAMLGYDETELATSIRKWMGRVYPIDRQGVENALNAFLDGDTDLYEHRHRMIQANRPARVVLSRASVVERSEGLPSRVLGVYIDVTERASGRYVK